MWQNERSMFDIARRDRCLDIWFPCSVGMVILQCACLALVTFSPRSTLSRWPRGVMTACAILMLGMNTRLKLLLFAPGNPLSGQAPFDFARLYGLRLSGGDVCAQSRSPR
jgi:hypothetical protein